MRIHSLRAFCLLLLCMGLHSLPAQTLPLIPRPAEVKPEPGKLLLDKATAFVCDDPSLESSVQVFNDYAEKLIGTRFRLLKGNPQGFSGQMIRLHLEKNEDEHPEAYRLTMGERHLDLTGRPAGIFRGLTTLLQLLTAHAEGNGFNLPRCSIADAPRYAWRGMHLDVCRHFFPKEFIKKYIDLIALHRMNTFHWHLTEDQGWRIEIKKYPELVQKGAWRKGSQVGAYSEMRFDTLRYGGYYSQEDIREIVAYAAARHITVVPEIEMPGHALAALATYPELSCTGGPFEPAKGWGVFEDVYCPNEKTFVFLKEVLTEVCDLFPGKYIHIGGDECPKVRWHNCARCQALIQREGLKDEHELQSWFIRQIEVFLNSKGKQIIGWDEILEGGLAPNAAVMSWRGTQGGIDAARMKHPVVMSPGSHCYFDHYQSLAQGEPIAIGGYTPLDKVYDYEPTPAELTPQEAAYILGAQGNVWTEYILNADQVEYMAVPRMCALSEVLWSPQQGKDYKDFFARLMRHFNLLTQLKVQYSRACFNVETQVQAGPSGGIQLSCTSPYAAGKVMYSWEDKGKMTTPYPLEGPQTIKAPGKWVMQLWENETPLGRPTEINFKFNLATGKGILLALPPDKRYQAQGGFTLVDGIQGTLPRRNPEWLGFSGTDMDATLDLGDMFTVNSVKLGVLSENGSWIYAPKSLEVWMSSDGEIWNKGGALDAAQIKTAGRWLTVPLKVKCRFLRVMASNLGTIPEGSPGSGNPAWLFVDEIIVE